MPQSLPVTVLLISALMWGLTWWPLKHFNGAGVGGIPLIVVAYGAVSLVLLPWVWRERTALRGHWHYFFLLVVFGGYANLAFAGAMIHGEVVRAMMLFYLAPVWGVLGGWAFLRERIDAVRAWGVVLALTGACLVLGAWDVVRAPPSAVDLLALTAGMAFALSNVTCRAAQAIPTGSKSAAVFVGCAVMATTILLVQGEALPEVAFATWGAVVVFGLGWLLIATIASQWAVTRLEAGRASIILLAELLTAVVSATLIRGERLDVLELVGGTLILLAALLEARRAGDQGGGAACG